MTVFLFNLESWLLSLWLLILFAQYLAMIDFLGPDKIRKLKTYKIFAEIFDYNVATCWLYGWHTDIYCIWSTVLLLDNLQVVINKRISLNKAKVKLVIIATDASILKLCWMLENIGCRWICYINLYSLEKLRFALDSNLTDFNSQLNLFVSNFKTKHLNQRNLFQMAFSIPNLISIEFPLWTAHLLTKCWF